MEFAKPRSLHLVSDPRGVFHCPIGSCDHISLKSTVKEVAESM